MDEAPAHLGVNTLDALILSRTIRALGWQFRLGRPLPDSFEDRIVGVDSEADVFLASKRSIELL
jgi:hypothetical protein